MKPRTRLILEALVKDFIETANPVASKKIIEVHLFDISSATVRNEFSILEEVGLIQSPHVSAGKIPTEKGYRFYVDEFIQQNNDQDEATVQRMFDRYITEYRTEKSKEKVFDVLRVISQLSGNVAFASINNDRTAYIGLSNVLRSPEFLNEPERAAQIVEILEGKQRLQNFLKGQSFNSEEVKIFIGEENLFEEINSCGMLACPFETKDIQGFLGILGPMRMKYGFNKALLKESIRML